MNEIEKFKKNVLQNIDKLGKDNELSEAALKLMIEAGRYKYTYNFTWMGRPIIQYPQDMVAMQEIIWKVKPDLIIETGIAHGGSLIMYASFMEMMEINHGHIIGIDIDIRKHNRIEIEKHPMFKRITIIEGSSISLLTVDKVKKIARNYKNIMIVLDSNHTHDHVLKELELYSFLVSKGSYCVVFDTIIEDMPKNSFPDRPWSRGNSPKTAVLEFLKKNKNFEVDMDTQNKLLITVAPDGYLKRVK